MRLRTVSFAALLAVVAAVARGGDEPDASLVRLDVKEKVLANGLRVLVAPRRCGPRVACAVWFRVGACDEEPGKTGLAHVLEHVMFKGTRRIGVKDAALGDKLAAQLDELWARRRGLEDQLGRGPLRELRAIERSRTDQLAKVRAALARLAATPSGGAIAQVSSEVRGLGLLHEAPDPPRAPVFRELRALEKRFDELLLEERRNNVREEFWDLYVNAGGTNLNAYTTEDTTNYVVTLPSNKLELFFWLEADRLAEPVFREWYPERDVVKEERRADENQPDGPFYEALGAVAYGPHPYGHPTLGWMADLDRLTPRDAREFFERHYSPANATCVLVGDVDPERAFALAEKWLGRVPARPPVERRVPAEPTAPGEKRLDVTAPSEPRVEILWRAPAAGAPGSAALDVIAALLSGEAGRLGRRLVTPADAVCLTAEAANEVHRYPGRFRVAARAKDGADLDAVQAALEAEVAALAGSLVPSDELARAKERLASEQVRALEELEGICDQLGRAQCVAGGWREALLRAERVQRVSPEEIQAAARLTFTRAGRTVGVLRRGAPEPLDEDRSDEAPGVPTHGPHRPPRRHADHGGASR